MPSVKTPPGFQELRDSLQYGTQNFNSVYEHKKSVMEIFCGWLSTNTSDKSRDDHHGGAVQANQNSVANENDSSHPMKKISTIANILYREIIGIAGNAPEVRLSEVTHNKWKRNVENKEYGMTPEKMKMANERFVEINENFRDVLGKTNLACVVESNLIQLLAVGIGVLRVDRVSDRKVNFAVVSMLDVTPSFGSTFGLPEIHIHVSMKQRELAERLKRIDENDQKRVEQNGKPYVETLMEKPDEMVKLTITQWPVYDPKLDCVKYWMVWWQEQSGIIAANSEPTLVPEYIFSVLNQTDNNMVGWGPIGERDLNDAMAEQELVEDLLQLVHKSAYPSLLINAKADPQKNIEGGLTGGDTIEVADHEGIKEMVPTQAQLAAMYQALNEKRTEDIKQYISSEGNKTHQTQIQRVQEEREKQTRRALLTNQLKDVFVTPVYKAVLYHVLERNPRLLEWDFMPNDAEYGEQDKISLVDIQFENFVSQANTADKLEKYQTIIQTVGQLPVGQGTLTDVFFDPLDVMHKMFVELGLSGYIREDYRQRFAALVEQKKKEAQEEHEARLAYLQQGKEPPQQQ